MDNSEYIKITELQARNVVNLGGKAVMIAGERAFTLDGQKHKFDLAIQSLQDNLNLEGEFKFMLKR